MDLSRIISISVRRGNATVARRSFGMPGFVCYHNAWAQRSRVFSDESELLTALTAGFVANGDNAATADSRAREHPAYLAALAFCSQTGRPPQFKVLRRAGKPTQKMRLAPPSSPIAGDVFSFSVRGVTFSVTADSTPTAAEITAAIAALVAGSATAIIASGVGSTTGAQDIAGASLNGTIGAGAISPPRNVTLTLNSHADWDATTAVVTGLDEAGRVQTENFAIPNNGNVTLTGTKLWSKITNLHIPPQSGAGGTLTMGTGTRFDANHLLVIAATDNTGTVDITSSNAGDWFGYDNVSSNLTLEDRSTDDSTTIGADLDAIYAADANWYALEVLDGESHDMIIAAAMWAEAKTVEHFPQTIDTNIETTDLVGTHYDLKAAARIRTFPIHSRKGHRSRFVAGLLGVMLGRPPGSAPWIYRQVAGQIADDLSSDAIARICGTAIDPLSGTRGLVYVNAVPTGTNSGTAITFGGFTSGGWWAQHVSGIDSLVADLQAAFVQRRINSENVPFNEEGAAIDEGDARQVMFKYATAPFNLLEQSSISVTHTDTTTIDAGTKALGNYDGIAIAASTQGTIATGNFRIVVN